MNRKEYSYSVRVYLDMKHVSKSVMLDLEKKNILC